MNAETTPTTCNDFALSIIDAAIASLRTNPNQMSLNVAVGDITGYNVSPHIEGGHAGTVIGLNSSPTFNGGTVGSYTGFTADAGAALNAAQITANAAGNGYAARQSAETIALLEQIRDALQKHDDSKAHSLLATLKEKAIDLVYEVVKTATIAALALPK